MEDLKQCSVCAGPLMHMGNLGKMAWFSCRNCGSQQTERLSADELVDTLTELGLNPYASQEG